MRVQCRAGAALNLMLWLNLKVDGALMAALRSYALPGEAVPLTALRLLRSAVGLPPPPGLVCDECRHSWRPQLGRVPEACPWCRSKFFRVVV